MDGRGRKVGVGGRAILWRWLYVCILPTCIDYLSLHHAVQVWMHARVPDPYRHPIERKKEAKERGASPIGLYAGSEHTSGQTYVEHRTYSTLLHSRVLSITLPHVLFCTVLC